MKNLEVLLVIFCPRQNYVSNYGFMAPCKHDSLMFLCASQSCFYVANIKLPHVFMLQTEGLCRRLFCYQELYFSRS